MSVNVVARFTDGQVVKGRVENLDTSKRSFHIFSAGRPAGTPSETVRFDDLKAVFIVRSLEGDPLFNENKEFRAGDASGGAKLKITFIDGEELFGASMNYDPDG